MTYGFEEPHLVRKMISFDDLLDAIEKLEIDGVISFEEFSKLPFVEVKKKFFLMVQPTTLQKAVTKIRDKREGKEGLSEVTNTTVHYNADGSIKIVERKHYF